MTTVSEISQTIIKQIQYNSAYNKQTDPSKLYDEICDFIKANFGNVSVSFGKTNSPKSVSRSNNFQYFLEHNGSVTVANKFF